MRTILFILTIGIIGVLLFSYCNDNSQKNEARYEGEDISGMAEILRDKKSKIATLRINTTEKWKLYAGNRARTINLSKPILEGEKGGSYSLNVPDSTRSYFQLVTDRGRTILAERHLPMEGGYNFRDLGGYKTEEGKFVKWGKVFRSDDLHSLTDADLKYLSSIPIITIVDFRSKEEINSAPDRIPELVHNDYAYSITPGNLTASSDSSAFDLSVLQGLDMDSIMSDINIQLVTDPESIKMYKKFFKLLEENRGPLLFHCTAGKDRTGMGAALFLIALGVNEETVMADYLLSNQFIKDKFADKTAQYPFLAPLFRVEPQYLQAGLDRIKSDHGTIDNYLRDVLGVNPEKIREIYLNDHFTINK